MKREWYIEDNIAYEPGTDGVDEENATHVVAMSDVQPLVDLLEAIRSQMCWERDRDQLTMGMSDLHEPVTKMLEKWNGK